MEFSLCYSFLVPEHTYIFTTEDNDTTRWLSLHRAVEYAEVRKVIEMMNGSSLSPVLIKGWAASRSYPNDKTRYATDIDLAFSKREFESAAKLFRESERRGLPVDVHDELRHLDSLPWDTLFDRSIIIDLDGVAVRILSDEDHLRVLAVHWLTDGGWNKDRLWDIFYLVDNRSTDFDWEKCLGAVSNTRRRWIVCAIGLTHRYLDLNIDDLPFADEAKDLPQWLIKALEREWASRLQLQPLLMFTSQPKLLWKQIMKRIPPNAIQSTIDMEGSFDSRFKFHYQVGSFFKRLKPAVKKIFVLIKHSKIGG